MHPPVLPRRCRRMRGLRAHARGDQGLACGGCARAGPHPRTRGLAPGGPRPTIPPFALSEPGVPAQAGRDDCRYARGLATGDSTHAPHPPRDRRRARPRRLRPVRRRRARLGRQRRAWPDEDRALHDRRRHVARPRRRARWPHDGVLDAGRPLSPADRRRPRHAPHLRPRLGRAAALLAGRPRDRLHLGSRRRQQPVADTGRWHAPGAGDEGALPPAQQPGLDAGRPVPHRPQAFHRSALAGRR